MLAILTILFILKSAVPLPQQADEPLMNFPFAQFLVNPCGFTENSSSYIQNNFKNDSAPLSQQATEFLRPFRDQYENVNYTVIDRNAFVQELQFLVEDAKRFNRRIYHPSVISQCEGIRLQFLPNEPLYLFDSGAVRIEDIYRRLILVAAQLHLVTHDSGRFLTCPNENDTLYQKIRQLTGKLETITCLTFHSIVGSSINYTNGRKFFQVVHYIIQTPTYRIQECSARELIGCSAVRYVDRILGTIQYLHGNN